jgi:hypothetical protein
MVGGGRYDRPMFNPYGDLSVYTLLDHTAKDVIFNFNFVIILLYF